MVIAAPPSAPDTEHVSVTRAAMIIEFGLFATVVVLAIVFAVLVTVMT